MENQTATDSGTVPAVVSSDLFGVLTRAGTFNVRDEELTGYVVECPRETLEAVASLPMYQPVAIVAQKQIAMMNGPAGPQAWLPIDTAPRDGTEILIRTNVGVVTAWLHAEAGECNQWVCYDDLFAIDADDGRVTHWMPLPSSPNNVLGRSAPHESR